MVAKVDVFISQYHCNGLRDCDEILHTAAYYMGLCALKVWVESSYVIISYKKSPHNF